MSIPDTVQVALPVPLPGLFDYLPPDLATIPKPGDRVLVPFGRRRLVGVVIGISDHSTVDPAALKPIDAILGESELPAELLELLLWTTRYYASPIGEIVTLGLPLALRRAKAFRAPPPAWLELTPGGQQVSLKRAPKQQLLQTILQTGPVERSALIQAGFSNNLLRRMQVDGWVRQADRPVCEVRPGPDLNPDQIRAVAEIAQSCGQFNAFVLAGVTGSGKTEVYLQAAQPIVESGQQILILVPEIGLTPQFVRRIETRLGQPAWVYHSGLSEGERLATWQAARSGRARIMIGTRSALFLPLKCPGLIVVDEEHDSSFKQFDGVRYHARDVAVKRASMLDIPVVLGSATPSLESLYNADQGRYSMLRLPKRVTQLGMPEWRIEDTRGKHAVGGLTEALLNRIRKRLSMGEQVLIYRNRRGYAPVLMCNECGWQADCAHCSAHLTWHRASRRVRCHHCGFVRPVPPRCPSCQAPDLHAGGSGTERIEAILSAELNDVPVLRVDRDSIQQRKQFDQLIRPVVEGEPCVIVGTQMIAKGHHWPGIGLAVVLDADQSLFSADFRGPERLAQTLFQVSGRAGRAKPGEFILQTRQPEHPLIDRLMNSDYLTVARWLLEERAQACLPPVGALAMVRAEAKQAGLAQAFLKRAAGQLASMEIQLAGPLPALLQRRAGFWRYQLWLSSPSRAEIISATKDLPQQLGKLKEAHRVRWHVDVDPQDL